MKIVVLKYLANHRTKWSELGDFQTNAMLPPDNAFMHLCDIEIGAIAPPRYSMEGISLERWD
jgi:hypothetical protein